MPEARLHEGSAFLIKGSLQLLLELGTHQLDIPAHCTTMPIQHLEPLHMMAASSRSVHQLVNNQRSDYQGVLAVCHCDGPTPALLFMCYLQLTGACLKM